MRLFFLIAFILLSGIQTYAIDNYPIGARSAGMSNASVVNKDVWATHHNQAGMAFYNNFAIAIHHENKFLIAKHAYKAALLTFPINKGTFGLTYSLFGYSKYNERKIGLSYAHLIHEKLAAAIQLDYLGTYQYEYGKSGTVAVEIGLLSEPVKNLYIGTHIFNPTYAKIDIPDEETVPTIFRFGIGYLFSDLLLINIETEKSTDFPVMYKIGAEYALFEGMFIRAGVSNNPDEYSFGLGYVYKKIKADIAFMSQRDLGFTPHFSVCYEIR